MVHPINCSCGTSPVMYVPLHPTPDAEHRVECLQCGTHIVDFSRDAAVRIWNELIGQRGATSPPPEQSPIAKRIAEARRLCGCTQCRGMTPTEAALDGTALQRPRTCVAAVVLQSLLASPTALFVPARKESEEP